MSRAHLLAELTTGEVPDEPRAVLLVPFGSCEQHGPHLPLGTDTTIATAVARGVAERQPGVVVAPAVAIGASGEHAGFAGTLSVGTEALEMMAVELVRSADAFAAVAFVNAHGGNGATLRRAAAQLRAEGRRVEVVSCAAPKDWDGPLDAHAGRTETSLLLHLAPDLVRLDRAVPGRLEPWPELAAQIVAGGVAAVSATGVLGDPTGASAEEGARLFAAIVERAGASVSALVAG